MKRIYWDRDKIAMLTDNTESVAHKHGMLQFFLCMDEEMEILVAQEKLRCTAMIVNKNVKHAFKTQNKLHLTIVFEPTSIIGMGLSKMLNDRDYYLLNESECAILQEAAKNMVAEYNKKTYQLFLQEIHHLCKVDCRQTILDERIISLMRLLDNCNCEEHIIEKYAKEVNLSTSRLSHLFREQVGIPLKSYLTLHQMECAFFALLNGENITNAAMRAGFDSASHFAATVKKNMGLPAGRTIKNSDFLKVYEE